MNDFTCIIASHISTIARLKALKEAIDSALPYFPVILSMSYDDKLETPTSKLLSHYPSVTKIITERKSQFQHINDAFPYLSSEYVIFLDDDDKFLPNITIDVPILLKRYGQHEGVQMTYENGEKTGWIDTDFSGTFCKTVMLGIFITDTDDLSVYDLDCEFREFITKNGRGKPNYHDDFGIDDDVTPYVYKREDDDVIKDWGVI